MWNCKPRGGRPQSLWLAAATVRLLCLAAVTVVSTSNASADEEGELVSVEFGEHGYLIPRQYINYSRKDPNGRSSIVDMRLLWPSLEPFSEANADRWQQRDTLHHLRVTLHEEGRSSFDTMGSVMALRGGAPDPLERPDGLLYREKNRTRAFSAAALGYTTPQGQPYVFFCNDFPPDTYKSFEVELLCIAEYELSDGTWIKVHFFEDNIANWRRIDAAVRNLVESFRR